MQKSKEKSRIQVHLICILGISYLIVSKVFNSYTCEVKSQNFYPNPKIVSDKDKIEYIEITQAPITIDITTEQTPQSCERNEKAKKANETQRTKFEKS